MLLCRLRAGRAATAAMEGANLAGEATLLVGTFETTSLNALSRACVTGNLVSCLGLVRDIGLLKALRKERFLQFLLLLRANGAVKHTLIALQSAVSLAFRSALIEGAELIAHVLANLTAHCAFGGTAYASM